MADPLPRWVGVAEPHPAIRVFTLVSLGTFLFGVAAGIVKAVSHLGVTYVVLIGGCAALFGICVA